MRQACMVSPESLVLVRQTAVRCIYTNIIFLIYKRFFSPADTSSFLYRSNLFTSNQTVKMDLTTCDWLRNILRKPSLAGLADKQLVYQASLGRTACSRRIVRLSASFWPLIWHQVSGSEKGVSQDQYSPLYHISML